MMQIHVFNAHPKWTIRVKEIIQLARRVFRGQGKHDVECNIIFINDHRMIKLNSTYFDHRYATDVLSFPFDELSGGVISGEVYVDLDQARRQAKEYHVTIKNEVSRLVVHGILHLTGHADTTQRGKRFMTKLENEYLPKT